MTHSYTQIFVHLVWSTKDRRRFVTNQLRPQLFHHFIEYCKLNNIYIDSLGIQPEHVHVLINLRSDQKVDDVVKLIKGESSHWINEENLIRPKFGWQRGYGAFSVSMSHLDAVRTYIRNQDEHHRKRSFMEEVQAILMKHGFNIAEMPAEEPTEEQNR